MSKNDDGEDCSDDDDNDDDNGDEDDDDDEDGDEGAGVPSGPSGGELYMWGSNAAGQLGLGVRSGVPRKYEPCRVHPPGSHLKVVDGELMR
jgi:hypothetical protein